MRVTLFLLAITDVLLSCYAFHANAPPCPTFSRSSVANPKIAFQFFKVRSFFDRGAHTSVQNTHKPLELRPGVIKMSSTIQFIDPEPRMSDAAIHNGVVYTSGVVCEEEGKDVTYQTKAALEYLDRLLAKCNSDKHHIMSMQVPSLFTRIFQETTALLMPVHKITRFALGLLRQVWLADIKEKPQMDAIYDAWVSKTAPPTRACVESALQPPYLVEFRAIAAQL